MIKIWKKTVLLILLLCAVLALNSCKENPSEEELYAKLLSHFEQRGFSCTLSGLPVDRNVPIYNASAWRTLTADGERGTGLF